MAAARFAPPRFAFLDTAPLLESAIAALLGGPRFAPTPEPMSKPEVIRAAMEGRQKVRATYLRKRDGVTADYVIRPYEVKPHDMSGTTMLYATEDDKHWPRAIHSFIYGRVLGVELIPSSRFAPVWPVKPESL